MKSKSKTFLSEAELLEQLEKAENDYLKDLEAFNMKIEEQRKAFMYITAGFFLLGLVLGHMLSKAL
jgi:hypothetical protein